MARFGRFSRFKFSPSDKGGFTLMEIIIVISITIILTAMVLGYSRSSEKQIVLYRDQATIIGVLNQAKALAIQKFNQPSSGYVACAFGVHFQNDNTYILYQDLASGTSCPRPRNYAYNPTLAAEKVQALVLDSRLKFSGLPSGGVDIAFIAPELTATSTKDLPVVISLQLADGSISAPIQVGIGGQIVTQ